MSQDGSAADVHEHEMATSGPALTALSVNATLHCLTGCAIGEVAGMVVGSSLGLATGATVMLSIALAFAFGYALTSLPPLRAGLALGTVIPIALASDTGCWPVARATVRCTRRGSMEGRLCGSSAPSPPPASSSARRC